MELKFVKLEESSEYIFNYKGFDVISTNHSEQRAITRNKLTQQELELIYQRMIDKAIELGYEQNTGSEYLFYSDSLKQGIVIGISKDKYKDSDQNAFVIITFLPRGRSNPRPGTEKVLVEKYVDDSDALTQSYLSQNFINYISSISNLQEALDTGCYIKIDNSDIDFSFYLYEGMVWDCNYEVIEI